MAEENITQDPQEDPLLKSSLGGHLAFWSLVCMVFVFWAWWDEEVTKRPYLQYQKQFVDVFDKVLVRELVKQQGSEKVAGKAAEYKTFTQTVEAEQAASKKQLADIDAKTKLIGKQLEAINQVVKYPKAEIGALTYDLEMAHGDRAKEAYRAKLKQVMSERKYKVDMPGAEGFTVYEETYEGLVKKTEDLKAERTRLSAERASVDAKRATAAKSRSKWLQQNMDGMPTNALVSILRSLNNFEYGIKQIHVADVDLVDRCMSCHIGMEYPEVDISDQALQDAGLTGEEHAEMRAMFKSHPKPDLVSGEINLLDIHPPERFGCAPCHNGNGRGLINTHLAHGLNKHWIWKLHRSENIEAGCQQCHAGSIYLEGAKTLTKGRQLFRDRACYACHKHEAYDREVEDLKQVVSKLQSNRTQWDKKLVEERQLKALEEKAETDEQIDSLFKRLDALGLEKTALTTEYDELRKQQRNLNFERKRPGPNLKELKAKVQRDWLAPWLKDPIAFRAKTKMPQFRLDDGQIEAISAFLWASAVDVTVPKQAAGDVAKGKTLFASRGCAGCHSLEADFEGGGVFAADLSRVGEKLNYDYLVRWIYDPRVRLAPYSPSLKKQRGDGDVLAADYRAVNKEPVWDRDNTDCPVTGEEMVVENQTVMPTLRLTWEECRDIASYLMTKKTDKAYPAAAWPAQPSEELLAKGKRLVQHFGCAGCHEIKGFEEEGRIGTELTVWGSKPLERLDFGHYTFEYKRNKKKKNAKDLPQYNHHTFAMQKLEHPEHWDHGKEKSFWDKLKMPNFHLDKGERVALTTFLLGSVTSELPKRFYYDGGDEGDAIKEGWWVIEKYNCNGCHQILPNHTPTLQSFKTEVDGDKVAPFAGAEGVANGPPTLVGQGFRTNPKWLAKFLRDPSLFNDYAEKTIHRNGVRQYMQIRMPTFKLTENEIAILVRFFAALSKQPVPAVEPPIDPLSANDAQAAADAFANQVCLKCHIADGPMTPQTIAPSFAISGERLTKAWMTRWLLDPAKLVPKTQMPSELFKMSDGHWQFASDKAKWPQSLQNYKGDHVELLVRYMRQYNELKSQKAKGDD